MHMMYDVKNVSGYSADVSGLKDSNSKRFTDAEGFVHLLNLSTHKPPSAVSYAHSQECM